MPSFYKNIIKDNCVEKSGKTKIITDYEISEKKTSPIEGNEKNSKEDVLRFEPLGQIIIEKAKRDRDEILRKTYEEIEDIRSTAYNDAYNKGYEEGKTNGYNDGYKEAYENNIKKAEIEAKQIIDNAEKLLLSAKREYETYIKEKREYILDLTLYIAQTVLNKEVEKDDSMDKVIFKALEESAKAKTYMIKCPSEYVEHIKEKITSWKEKLALSNCEVFVIMDDSIEKGNALIEKDNGKILVGIDIALENIKKELF